MKNLLKFFMVLCALSIFLLLSSAQQVNKGNANINGASIYYEIKGEGTPIVLMHGFALDTRIWDYQFDVFAKEYKVIRYDFRGFGKSSLPDTLVQYSHIKDLTTLLEFLHLNNVIIIAHSMGGLAALEFTYNNQNKVNALIFAEGAASIKGFNNQPGSKEVGEMFGKVFDIGKKEGVEKGKEALMQVGVSESALKNPISTETFKQMVSDYSGWHWVNTNPIQKYKRIAFEDLSNIQIPVLLINGELSHDHYHQTLQKMHNNLPNSKLVVLKNAGHMLGLENPDQFNQEVISFLNENGIK